MTPEELEYLKNFWKEVNEGYNEDDAWAHEIFAHENIPILFAEIERLQAENERLQKQWDETRESRLLNQPWNDEAWD